MYRIAVLPGDGIGREIIPVAVHILKQTADLFRLNLQIEYGLISEEAYAREGHPLPPSTLTLCQNSVAVLLGAVGSPVMDRHLGVTSERAALLPPEKNSVCTPLDQSNLPELIPASVEKEIIENGFSGSGIDRRTPLKKITRRRPREEIASIS